MAFLTKGIRIILRDDREDEPVQKVFHYEGGIKEFVSYLNRGKTPLYPEIVYCEGNRDGVFCGGCPSAQRRLQRGCLQLCKQHHHPGAEHILPVFVTP
mgnify:CR=1 FL=1